MLKNNKYCVDTNIVIYCVQDLYLRILKKYADELNITESEKIFIADLEVHNLLNPTNSDLTKHQVRILYSIIEKNDKRIERIWQSCEEELRDEFVSQAKNELSESIHKTNTEILKFATCLVNLYEELEDEDFENLGSSFQKGLELCKKLQNEYYNCLENLDDMDKDVFNNLRLLCVKVCNFYKVHKKDEIPKICYSDFMYDIYYDPIFEQNYEVFVKSTRVNIVTGLKKLFVNLYSGNIKFCLTPEVQLELDNDERTIGKNYEKLFYCIKEVEVSKELTAKIEELASLYMGDDTENYKIVKTSLVKFHNRKIIDGNKNEIYFCEKEHALMLKNLSSIKHYSDAIIRAQATVLGYDLLSEDDGLYGKVNGRKQKKWTNNVNQALEYEVNSDVLNLEEFNEKVR